jgi:two-component system, NarL family, sensor kinase
MQDKEIYVLVVAGIILALLLVGFIVTILFLYQRRQHRQEQMMTEMKDEYEQELLKSQLEIQETTFKNIGQEIHDNIGQTLSLVKLTLSTLPVTKDSPVYETIRDSKEMLNKAILDLADLSKSLHTDRIAQIGIAEAIQFELNMLNRTGLFKADMKVKGDIRNLDDQKEIFLFRITQEILNNIVKHSKASSILITLFFREEKFLLEVADNGVGFDTVKMQNSGSPTSGVGLRSMKNRAKLIGANINISSVPDNGTTIVVDLPY